MTETPFGGYILPITRGTQGEALRAARAVIRIAARIGDRDDAITVLMALGLDEQVTL